MSCFNCRGKGPAARDACRLCKATGWIEILGAGMVHPRLLELAGYADAGRSDGVRVWDGDRAHRDAASSRFPICACCFRAISGF